MKRFSIGKIVIFLSLILLFLTVILTFISKLEKGDEVNSWHMISLTHNGNTIPFEVVFARDDSARRKGLSIFSSLKKRHGMLFLFPDEGIHSFWMKDMQFPIDILWFNSNGELCDIKERAKPEEYPAVYTPECRSRYVLEIPAGEGKKYQLRKGDTIDLSRIPGDVLSAE